MTPYSSEWVDKRGINLVVPSGLIHTSQADHIVNHLVPQWLTLFLEKNSKYRDVDNSLGPAGVFPDVWRKVGILKTRIWIGQDTPGESNEEVVMDLIGHLFLMWHMMQVDKESDTVQPIPQEAVDVLREVHHETDCVVCEERARQDMKVKSPYAEGEPHQADFLRT